MATALAAGLDGLLLYCRRAANEGNPTDFRKKEKISKLFKRMAATSRDYRFPRADMWFDIKFRTSRRDKYLESLVMEDNTHQQLSSGGKSRYQC